MKKLKLVTRFLIKGKLITFKVSVNYFIHYSIYIIFVVPEGNNSNDDVNEAAREVTTKQISKGSHFELEMQDLASVLIEIDEEFNTIKGKKKRVETLFDFYHMKSSNLAKLYKNAVTAFSPRIELKK